MRTVSLFSGIGGIEYGLHKHGFKPVLFCEIDPIARAILRRRFSDVEIATDVRRLSRLPDCELVTAGFPCQDLSQAGAKRGINGTHSGLVASVFGLLERKAEHKRPECVLIENVPYMLRLARGNAMTYITTRLVELGYKWAYRVVDARCFGLPQRRPRVVILAARSSDPRQVVLADDHDEPQLDGKPIDVDPDSCYGFYWTEGSRGVGWVQEGVPPIKCGSTLGIASPPAVWIPRDDFVGTLDISDAERLQGFPVGWTDFTKLAIDAKPGLRWRLIGNAVSTKLSDWIGRRLRSPRRLKGTSEPVRVNRVWPDAAYGDATGAFVAHVGRWASDTSPIPLSRFISLSSLKPLSSKATEGFLARAQICTNVVYSNRFIASLSRHATRCRRAPVHA
jgi:DNA (cytosine-5)-methyltransferase 1